MQQRPNRGEYVRLSSEASLKAGRRSQRDIDLNEIVVERPRTSTPKSTSRATVPRRKPQVRPLNVSDDYEIVGGVPAFVWKSSQDYNPSVRRYAISSDNRHIAIQEGWHKICVYNMLDNFSLFATWEDTSFERIATFIFHNNQINELVLVFKDSTVVLISVSSKTEVEPHEATSSHQDIEDVKLKKKFLIFDTQKDASRIRFEIANESLETWVVAYDMNVRHTIFLLSIKEEGFQCVQVNIGVDMLHAFSYCSINEKVLMLVKTSRDGSKPLTTTIFQGIDFIRKPIEDVPITIEGQSFGFSPCGNYFLVWNSKSFRNNSIELYEAWASEGLYKPIASRSIGQNVYTTRGQFLIKDNDQEFNGQEAQASPLMVAFLVGKSNQVLLTLWEPLIDKEVKTLDLTMEEMPLSRSVHIEFCVSSNVKWVALGCWTNGIFSLFSIKTKLFIWRIKLDTTTSLLSSFTPLKFDSSNTKLIINACNNLYVFCPACLVEAYELEFQNVTYDFLQNSDGEIEPLNMNHCLLIPAHIIKQIIILQHGPESYMDKKVIDVASSTITSSIALLIYKDSSLFVLEGSFETFFTTSFQEYVKSSLSKPKLPRSMREINVPTPSLHPSRFVYNKQFAWIFLRPNIEKDADSIVLFLAQDELLGFFDNPDCAQDLDQVPFSFVSCFAIKQSKDGSSVCCLHNNGVSVIDLNMRRTLYNVPYNVYLVQHLRIYIIKKGQGCFDITSNGRNIIIGWDTINGRMLTLTSTMDAEECKIVLEKGNNSVRTWLFREDCKAFIFIESKEDNNIVSSICIYNVEDYHLKRITREQCSLQAAKIMDLITKEGIQKHALNLDKNSGQLWFITLQTALRFAQLTFMPSNSYSLENCIPYLCPSSFDKQDTGKLAQLAIDFGPSLFSMEFNGNNNLDCVSKNFDGEVMAEVFNIALKYGAFSAKAFVEGLKNPVWRDSLKSAIINKNKKMATLLLGLLENNSIPFKSQAVVWKVGFEGLWMNYRGLFENVMQNNELEQKFCEIEVPSDIFTKEVFIETRIGAINDIPTQWEESSDQAIATNYWRFLNKDQLKNIRRQGGNETTLARVTFFSIAEACKIGLNGIIRFLLMQEAPPSVFKTSLIKWVITYKWEKIWKKRSFRSLMFYALFMALYSIYSLWIAFARNSLYNNMLESVSLTILLLILMLFALTFLYQEFIQMNTYIEDGKALFSGNSRWGLSKYWKSIWNLAEVFSYIMIIIVIPILHFTNLFGINAISILFCCIALESILIWIKVWYFAQAFKKTGAFVLMIENVIIDCVPFICLAIVILFGFSFALFVLFQQALHEKKSESDDGDKNEIIHIIERSFGDPWKTMVTMFYAMIGTFDPEIYYDSGSLSSIITVLFILYLAIQLIVMVNMLIATMGDTFDRVKSTNEEQLLMGRARFIDACEAQLKQEDITKLENSIGTYLFVLFPNDGEIIDEMQVWQGRVKTIEDRVGDMIKELRKEIIMKLEENFGKMTTVEECTNQLETMNIEIKEMKRDIEQIKNVLFLLKDRSYEHNTPLY